MILTAASTTLTLQTAIYRILLSLLIGGLIGLERQLKFQSAGLRTFTLICLGSTLAMLLSLWLPIMLGDGFFHGDPARMAAQVLSGIGFLGAGAIIHHRGSIQGLTTAASIWVSAIIGMGIGAGLYIPSIIMAVIVLFVLNVDDALGRRTNWGGRTRYMELCFSGIQNRIPEIETILREYKIRVIDLDNDVNFDLQNRTYVLHIRVKNSQYENQAVDALSKLQNLLRVSVTN